VPAKAREVIKKEMLTASELIMCIKTFEGVKYNNA
jgi:hypothetical protein